VRGLAGYLGYRLAAGFFGLLPARAVARIGYGLGYVTSYVAGSKREMATRHMRRVRAHRGDDVSLAEVTRATRRLFGWYGRYWAEVFWVRPRRFDRIVATTDLVNVSIVEHARDAGNGIILALPHMGNWEAAGARAKVLRIPVLAVAEALPNRRLIEWFTTVRNQLGIDIVIARRGARVTDALTERLQAGGTVALVADRDLGGRGIPVEFFGEKTTLPAGPAVLAARTGAALIPVGCYFDGRGHRFEVREPINVPNTGSESEKLAVITARLAAVFEDLIAAAPEQWHLLVPNWPSDREEQA
jgi:KDO2-lipid IV(A) lauroyltransferase